MTDISNRDDIIDSRDVIERLDDLTLDRDLMQDAIDNAETDNARAQAQCALANWADADELKALQALADEAEGYADDWRDGATLIRDSHFSDYVEQLLDDCGELPKDLPHYVVIDWEATARNVQADYTSVDFDGITYWVR